MSEDICERLVRFNQHKECVSTDLEVEAAAEITRLRQENTRLQAERDKAVEEMWKASDQAQAFRKMVEERKA